MLKKLWVVTISEEMIVFAESPSEAMSEARDALSNGDSNPEPETARPMTWLPVGWDLESIPFGSYDGLTLENLIAAGAAPEYIAAQEKLAALRTAAVVKAAAKPKDPETDDNAHVRTDTSPARESHLRVLAQTDNAMRDAMAMLDAARTRKAGSPKETPTPEGTKDPVP